MKFQRTFYEPWSSRPLVVRRLVWWWLLPLCISVTGATWDAFQDPNARVALLAANPSQYWFNVYLRIGILWASIMIALFAVWKGLRRIKRAYAAADGRICTGCLHDVSGLGESGLCPECGRPFEIAEDWRSWKQAGVGKNRTKGLVHE
ncbi:MAG: hypothetical protein K8R92_00325 [Planctomycetes bacterium]|nr:hypothetical protein [Planctomycetota bacterium]